MIRKRTLLGSIIGACLMIAIVGGCSSGDSGTPTAPPDPIVSSDAGTSGGSGGGSDVTALAAIDIEKRTNGVDADTGTGPNIPVDSPVFWSYQITNTGIETLTEIAAVDDPEGSIVCPSDTLEGGDTMTCEEKEGVAVLGPYTNTATVSAQAPSGPVEDSDNSAYTGVEEGGLVALDLEKRTNDEDADTPTGPIVLATLDLEEDVEWTYLVTNNSDEPATGISILDTPEGLVDCPRETLEAGGDSMICGPLMSVAVPGQYSNEATVTATIDEETVTATDASHYFGSDPGISLNKLTDGVDGIAPDLVPGCPVVWSYVLTNTGNIDLEQIDVVDTPEGAAACPSEELPEGAGEMTCEITGTVRIDGVDTYDNSATVTATDPVGNPVSASDVGGYTVFNQPPICDPAVASPAELWPPNHNLIEVTIANIQDVCERALEVRFDRVYQDEPVNDIGDGNTEPDAVGVGTNSLQIRSERQGGGDGRVYYVDFTATDPVEEFCSGTVTVSVPHDQGGPGAVDSGPPYYDSVTGDVLP